MRERRCRGASTPRRPLVPRSARATSSAWPRPARARCSPWIASTRRRCCTTPPPPPHTAPRTPSLPAHTLTAALLLFSLLRCASVRPSVLRRLLRCAQPRRAQRRCDGVEQPRAQRPRSAQPALLRYRRPHCASAARAADTAAVMARPCIHYIIPYDTLLSTMAPPLASARHAAVRAEDTQAPRQMVCAAAAFTAQTDKCVHALCIRAAAEAAMAFAVSHASARTAARWASCDTSAFASASSSADGDGNGGLCDHRDSRGCSAE